MKRYQLTLLLLLLLSPAGLMAQEDVQINKKEFNIGKEGFREAWDHIKSGDESYDLGGGLYTDALEHYLMALEYNPGNAGLNYKTGVSCLFGDRPHEALDFLLVAREADPEVSQDLMLLTGLAYQSKGDFGMALDCYNKYSDMFMESGKVNPIVNRYIKECNRAIEMTAEITEAEIINLGGGVNSDSDDYSPVVADENSLLYFTSRRNMQSKGERNSKDMKYDESIFLSTRTNGTWGEAEIAGRSIATELNEGVLYVDRFNKVMYVYAGWLGNGDIFVSEFKKEEWTEPVAVGGGVNSQSRETSFSTPWNSNERFFTSDRSKGGYGGRDIWYSRRIKKEKWTKPVNLGPVVNSSGNEESVWTSSTGDTIWFSSNGLDGIGGYDVYISYKDDTGTWSEPENLGIPVNSQWDDLFYRPITGNDKRAYFLSNRPRGRGGFDIYEVIYPDNSEVNSGESVVIVDMNYDTLPAVLNDTIVFFKPDTSIVATVPDSLHIVFPDSLFIVIPDLLPGIKF